MNKIKYFAQKPQLRKYNLRGAKIELEINKNVFPPSICSLAFAESMMVNSNETVIDVGTGSGFLGIFAAKLGGTVWATDTNNAAIETAKKNANKNNVKINFQKGSYFADFNKKFDVIIANLPQDIVPKSYVTAIGSKLAMSIYSGSSGNKHTLEFLGQVKRHMHKNSRAYISICCLTDFKPSMKKMLLNFNSKLVNFSVHQTKEFVKDNLEMYQKLNNAGKIIIFKKRQKWMTYEYIFELTLK